MSDGHEGTAEERPMTPFEYEREKWRKVLLADRRAMYRVPDALSFGILMGSILATLFILVMVLSLNVGGAG